MTAPRRMLVISFSYAPMLNARAFRWTALAAHFAAHGWQVDVLTSRQPGLPAEESAGQLRVHRVGSAWAESLRGLLRRRRGQVVHGAGAAAGVPAEVGMVSNGGITWIFAEISGKATP